MMLAAVCVLVRYCFATPGQSAGKFSGIISDPSGCGREATSHYDITNGRVTDQMTTSDAEGKYSFVDCSWRI